MLIVSVLSVVSTVAAIAYLVTENEEYRDAASGASAPVVGTVTDVDMDTRYFAVEWTDDQGRQWTESLVQSRRGAEGVVDVGDSVALYYNPDAPEIGAFVDPGDSPPVAAALAGPIALLALCLPVPLAWLARWLGMWRATRAPVVDASVQAHSSVYDGIALRPGAHQDGPLWLEIGNGAIPWYQRIMWSDRLVERGGDTLDYAVVRGRPRARRPIFVVDVPGVGRLWPAGRARRRTRWWALRPLSQRPPFSTHAAPLSRRVVMAVIAVAVVGFLLWRLTTISGALVVGYAVIQLVALIFLLGGNTLGFLRRSA